MNTHGTSEKDRSSVIRVISCCISAPLRFTSLVPLFGVFSLAQSAAQASAGTLDGCHRFGLSVWFATKSADDLAKMRERFGKLSDTDLDAYRFVCTQWLG